MNESGKQIEFTPKELKWWTFKFIVKHPIWSLKEIIDWYKGLGDGG